MGRTSIAVLYYRHLEMLHRRYLGVGMPRIRSHPLPTKVPPGARTACAYLSCFVFVVALSRLPKKPGGEPCARGTVRRPVDT
jgi:hypothetical protein